MRDNLEIYKIWAPHDSIWSAWAKPVLFAQGLRNTYVQLDTVEVSGWSAGMDKHTMCVVDLPDKSSIEKGLELAERGYRPIPLYNGVCEDVDSNSLVRVLDIQKGLYWGASILEGMSIHKDAPPAFLLDSNRMHGGNEVSPGRYDNRWGIFSQDMPSASFLIAHEIKKIVVYSNFIEEDLTHVLFRYQNAGLAIYLCNGQRQEESLIKVRRPFRFKNVGYRFKIIAKLKRNGAGGFGGMIPEPHQSSGRGHRRYYGMG